MSLPLMPKNQTPGLVAYAHIAMGFVNLRNSTSCPDDETSTDKRNHFHPIPRHIYIQRPLQYWPSPCSASSSSV